MAQGAGTRLPDPPILAITDRSQSSRPLEETAAALFEGGCRWLTVRDKDLPERERRALAARLVRIGHEAGATVLVSGDVATAEAAGADGIHVPAGVAVSDLRRILGAGALIGVSAHSADDLSRAAADGADYATLSPIWETSSKPGYGPALGPEPLAALSAGAGLPVLALGGVTAERVPALRDAGAAGFAVMGEVMRATDAAGCMRTLLEAWRAG